MAETILQAIAKYLHKRQRSSIQRITLVIYEKSMVRSFEQAMTAAVDSKSDSTWQSIKKKLTSIGGGE